MSIRDEVMSHINSAADFDGAVVITCDLKKKTATNWWTFHGHPEFWTRSDCSSVAQQLTAHVAELLKGDANNPDQREVQIKEPRFVSLGPLRQEHWTCLAYIGIKLRTKKRLWLGWWFTTERFGLEISWAQGLHILVGPFDFSARIVTLGL